MRSVLLAAVAAVAAMAATGLAQTGAWTLTNPVARPFQDEPVRLKIALPADARQGGYVVKADGEEVPCQVEQVRGRTFIWVLATFEVPAEQMAAELKKDGLALPDASRLATLQAKAKQRQASREEQQELRKLDEAARKVRQVEERLLGARQIRYEVAPGRPRAFEPKVAVKREGDAYVIDNGLIGVKVPAAAGVGIPGPVGAIRLPTGEWVGVSAWHTGRKLKQFSAAVIGDGTIFGKVRLRYAFEGMAGLDGKTPAFAVVDVAVYPQHRHATITEWHEMSPADWWEFDCAKGWGARQAVVDPYGSWGKPAEITQWPPTTLAVGQTRMGDTLLNLIPRWNQGCDEGWFFGAADEANLVGALPARVGRWAWPHNNMILVKVRPSGDYAGLRCSTWKGSRYWFLLAGPREVWQGRRGYLYRHGFWPLDKIVHEFITDWPGVGGRFNAFDYLAINPTGGWRGKGRGALANPGGDGTVATLTEAQGIFHPDTYGNYWLFCSPENPNFFTDFIKPGIGYVSKLKKHPRFKELARMAELKLREDLYHSITLPGGAGQECPGYVAYAMRHWRALADVCRKHLGFDPTRWPRYAAGASFLLHLSQPIGGGRRRCHPGGDTHPLGPDVLKLAEEFGVREDLKAFQTEELPGFGIVFRNRPGTADETYLAFKSGPNRGHYHGDQLSLHYCARAGQRAIDHMCSYGPRAGQEHMHNRVAFHVEKMPYANMDGYERVIALKTSAAADVGMGQVESPRLRVTTERPPEVWDCYLPQVILDEPLRYRRTIVLLKGGPEDYFVIRDQHTGPKLKATYCLHVLSDKCDRDGVTVRFGNLTVFCAAPRQFEYGRHDWDFQRGGLKEFTKGIRLTVEGATSEFVTVLYPGANPPAMKAVAGGVQVGDDEVIFAGSVDDRDAATYVTVRRAGKVVLTLTGADIDMDRSQGEIGLFVPDAGYPFGEIPDWLIRQRGRRPKWLAGYRDLELFDALVGRPAPPP